MEPEESQGELLVALRELYPQLSEVELVEAQNNLEEHMKIVDAIFRRLQNSPEAQERYEKLKRDHQRLFGLDEPNRSGSLNAPKFSGF